MTSLAAERKVRSPALSAVRRGVVFLAVFLALQQGWSAARGGWLERLVIDKLTVGGAVALISRISPALRVWGEGPRIRAVGGGLNILNGCEGVDVAFLLIAALCAMPGNPRRRLGGMAAGVALVFVLNQARILALFHAFRHDKALFALLHGTVAPLAMIACTVLFVAAWSQSRRRRDGA